MIRNQKASFWLFSRYSGVLKLSSSNHISLLFFSSILSMAPLLNTKVNLSDISLRPFEESDLDDYMTFKGDDNVSQFCGWNTMSKEEAFNDLLYAIYKHPWYRAICVKDRPIGCIFVKQGEGSDRCRGEIGYVLGSEYWGQGIATHAVKMVISSIFSELEGLKRLGALIDVENLRSQRVVEKAGFIREGVLRKYWILRGRTLDMVIYSLLKTDSTVYGLYSLDIMLEQSSIS